MTRARNSLTPFLEWIVITCVAMVIVAGCGDDSGSPKENDTTTESTSSESPENESGAEEGVQKVKPAAGKGNVQGKVLFNGKPAANIEVTLCEKFNRFGGGCDGAKFTARTDAGGEYVVNDVPPGEYEALLAAVFDTDSYIFATQGFGGIKSATYKVEADKTLFVRPTNLFKSDLKTSNPKAGSKVSAQGLVLQWQPYEDAAYYKFSLFPDSATVSAPYVTQRVDSTAFAVDKPVVGGGYRLEIEAFNADDVKIAENSNDIMFTVIDNAPVAVP